MSEYSARLGHSHQVASSQYPISSVPPTTNQTRFPDQQLSSASSYANLDYLFGVQDIKMIAPKASRNRRRTSDPSHVKHRRTRSGCYTCRSRRVKCDEGRPTCERCKKGSRECVYPEPTTGSRSAGAKSSQISTDDSRDSSSQDEDGDAVFDVLDSIPDEDEHLDAQLSYDKISNASGLRRASSPLSNGPRTSTRHASETPSLVQDKGSSPTPSTEGSVGLPSQQASRVKRHPQQFPLTSGPPGIQEQWAHLAPDLQFYLTYFYENITYMHYSIKFDPHNFLHTELIPAALKNEALLYGIVGFAAFQRTLHQPDGKIEHFLPYYNKAVSLLLSSLLRGEKHNDGTLMAILQLTTIEEFLGDWVNLLGHQKAAYEILTEIYSPKTVMILPLSRTILDWYMRFDVFAGLLGGFQTVLSRDWFVDGIRYFQQQSLFEPGVVAWKIYAQYWQSRLLAMDMSLLFARVGKGEITPKQFEIENVTLGQRFEEWKTKIDPALQDPQYLVQEFRDVPPATCEGVVNPWQPGYFFEGPLYPMNLATMDFLSIDIMHKIQTAKITGVEIGPDIVQQAYQSCQLFEAIELWPDSPKGTILGLQASLGISLLFLPRDDMHAMWGRRKLAIVESNGYIYPITFRNKFADLFRDRSCMHWWLPNNERYPAIVKSIRRFVEERTSPAKDTPTENLKDMKDMKRIFETLKLDDDEPPSTDGMR